MNERIKELAEQAGSTHKQSLGVYQFYAYELTKFAELIIDECARIASATPCPYKDDRMMENLGHTWDMACSAAGNAVRKLK